MVKSVTIRASIIGGFGVILAALIAGYFQSNANSKEGISIAIKNSNIKGSVIGEYNEIAPTQTDEQNSLYIRQNETKIIGFLRYRNNENYFEARNNLFSPLSAKFSEEKMKKFHDNITNIFITLNMKLIGEIGVGNNFVVSKHLVVIKYSYNSEEYIDEVLFSVRSRISDNKETHIELIECYPKTNTPLCAFLQNF